MSSWYVGSTLWEHWRKHFSFTPEQAKERWFWAPWRARHGFKEVIP